MPARNVVSGGMSNSGVKYSRLATDDDGYIDLQVRPWFHCNVTSEERKAPSIGDNEIFIRF